MSIHNKLFDNGVSFLCYLHTEKLWVGYPIRHPKKWNSPVPLVNYADEAKLCSAERNEKHSI